MQTVLEAVAEVAYNTDTCFIAFGIRSEFCLLLMEDFFLPKTFFFKVNLYISPAIYIPSKTLKTLNDFLFCHLFLKEVEGGWGGGGRGAEGHIVKVLMLVATAYNII